MAGDQSQLGSLNAPHCFAGPVRVRAARWNGFFAPAGVRDEVPQKLQASIRTPQRSMPVAKLYRNLGFELPYETQRQFRPRSH